MHAWQAFYWLVTLHLLRSLSRPRFNFIVVGGNDLGFLKCVYISVHRNSLVFFIFNPSQLPCRWCVKRGMSRECGWLSLSLVLGREPRLLKLTQGFLLTTWRWGKFITFSEYNSVVLACLRSMPVETSTWGGLLWLTTSEGPLHICLALCAWTRQHGSVGDSREQLFTSREQEGESNRKWPGVVYLSDPPSFVSPAS